MGYSVYFIVNGIFIIQILEKTGLGVNIIAYIIHWDFLNNLAVE